jgi:hypothetical protein
MTAYFRVLQPENSRFGVAYSSVDEELILLPYEGRVGAWAPPRLRLRGGKPSDYLANDQRLRLCSDRLKEVLEKTAAASDEMQWLPVEVEGDHGVAAYQALHFPNPPDVLDPDRTLWAEDFVVKPVLSRRKAHLHRIFCYPKSEGRPLFVAHEVKTAIVGAGCTGLYFRTARMAP